MSAPFRVRDLGSIMGGWPFLRSSDGSSETQLIGGVIDSKARIVGTRQEPSAGFAGLDAKAFLLYVDSDPNSPFTVTFSDPGSSGLTCDDLVTQINATTTPGPLPGTVAYNENNFLVLKSPTGGDGSYLRVASVAGSEDVFSILGMFSETQAWGGEISQAPHVDPDRQVALPGQTSFMWGENFSANAFNRFAMQMAVHADRSIGVLERKRLAVFKRKARAVADIQTSGSDKYFRLITTPGPTDEEWIYMGPYASGHAEFDPELALAIVDADGNEITVEDETIVDETSVPSEMSFSYEADSEFQLITNSSVPAIFAGVNETGDYYVRVTGLTGSASSLNGRLLKITLKISSSEVVVQALSSSGVRVPITDANKTGTMTMEAVQLVTKKVKAEGFYKESGLTTRLEQVQETKVASVGITGLQLNNRVVVSGETFLSTVAAGDIATISGHTNTVPHSNNGTYRVSKVVDNETLELVGEDWGPVYLNTQTAVSLGDLTVTSDGDFFDNPYIKFDDPDVVPPGDFYVLYQAMRTFKGAVEEDPGVFAAPTKYLQEGSHNTTKAILGIIGPSVDNLDEAINWLYGDRRNNMEDLYDRVNMEHYGHELGGGAAGRHRDIRPDTIDMFPEVLGTTVTIRSANNVSEDTALKMRLLDRSGNLVFSVDGQGHVAISDDSAVAGSLDFYIIKSGESAQMYVETLGTYQARVATYAWGDMSAQIVSEGNTSRSWLYLANATAGWYVMADGNTVACKRSTTPYWTVDGTRAQFLANVDFAPAANNTQSLGTSSYWWKEIWAYQLTLEAGSATQGVGSDLVPTTDGSRDLGWPSWRWGSIFLADQIAMENPTDIMALPNFYLETQYSHLPGLAGPLELRGTYLGSDNPTNVRYGVYSRNTWKGTSGGNNLWHLAAFYGYFVNDVTSTLNVTNGHNFRSGGGIGYSAGGKVLDFAHFRVDALTGTAAGVDKQYGLYVQELTLANSENWAIYTAGSTPSRFGGNVTIGGSADIGGNADVGGDLIMGAETVTESDMSYAMEWARLQKGSTGANFIIGGLSLENDFGAVVQDQLGVQQGIAWINGVVHRFGALTLDGSTTGAWLSGSVPATGRWCWVYVHPTQGVKVGVTYPQFQLNKPGTGESMAGAGDTNRDNWLYLGSVYWDTGQRWRTFRRVGDLVFYETGPDGYFISNSWDNSENGDYKNFDINMGFDNFPDDGDSRIPGVILSLSCGEGAATTPSGSLYEFKLYHGEGGTAGHGLLAWRGLMAPAYDERRIQTGPFVVMTKRVASTLIRCSAVCDGVGTGSISMTINVVGYVEPMNTPGSNRYIY